MKNKQRLAVASALQVVTVLVAVGVTLLVIVSIDRLFQGLTSAIHYKPTWVVVLTIVGDLVLFAGFAALFGLFGYGVGRVWYHARDEWRFARYLTQGGEPSLYRRWEKDPTRYTPIAFSSSKPENSPRVR